MTVKMPASYTGPRNGSAATPANGSDPCEDDGISPAAIGLLTGSFATAAAGATMMGFGIRDRALAKREARRRLSIAAAPTRHGATFAFTLRF